MDNQIKYKDYVKYCPHLKELIRQLDTLPPTAQGYKQLRQNIYNKKYGFKIGRGCRKCGSKKVKEPGNQVKIELEKLIEFRKKTVAIVGLKNYKRLFKDKDMELKKLKKQV